MRATKRVHEVSVGRRPLDFRGVDHIYAGGDDGEPKIQWNAIAVSYPLCVLDLRDRDTRGIREECGRDVEFYLLDS